MFSIDGDHVTQAQKLIFKLLINHGHSPKSLSQILGIPAKKIESCIALSTEEIERVLSFGRLLDDDSLIV